MRVAVLSLFSALLIVLIPGLARAECGLLETSCVVDTVEETVDDAVDAVDTTVDEVVDTVDTTVDEVVDTVDTTVDEVVDTVDTTVDTVDTTVEEVVDTVDMTVNDVVDTVEETVDDTVGVVEDAIDPVEDAIDPIDDPDEPVDDAIDPVVPGGSEPETDDPSGNQPQPETETIVARPDEDAADPPGETITVDLVGASAPAAAGTLTTNAITRSPFDAFGPFYGSLPEIARRLAFPFVLVVLVIGFVAVQNRLDRKDPKLALAATTPDVLSFT